jgi:hypothetical protein
MRSGSVFACGVLLVATLPPRSGLLQDQVRHAPRIEIDLPTTDLSALLACSIAGTARALSAMLPPQDRQPVYVELAADCGDNVEGNVIFEKFFVLPDPKSSGYVVEKAAA